MQSFVFAIPVGDAKQGYDHRHLFVSYPWRVDYLAGTILGLDMLTLLRMGC